MKTREVHNKNPLTYRKGKKRLCAMSIKQLTDITEKEKSGKRYEAARKEIARKNKLGIVYKTSTPQEEPEHDQEQTTA